MLTLLCLKNMGVLPLTLRGSRSRGSGSGSRCRCRCGSRRGWGLYGAM